LSASEIVNKVWNYAHVLRDDGVGYGDYVEQITYLIFLKMADERETAGQQVQVPNKYAWADPACGTGGFLLAAHDYMAAQATSKKEQRHLKEHALRGNDIVDSVVRLCAMNLYLHGIGPSDNDNECPISAADALAKEVGDDRVDMVLANPPFGKNSISQCVLTY